MKYDHTVLNGLPKRPVAARLLLLMCKTVDLKAGTLFAGFQVSCPRQ